MWADILPRNWLKWALMFILHTGRLIRNHILPAKNLMKKLSAPFAILKILTEFLILSPNMKLNIFFMLPPSRLLIPRILIPAKHLSLTLWVRLTFLKPAGAHQKLKEWLWRQATKRTGRSAVMPKKMSRWPATTLMMFQNLAPI